MLDATETLLADRTFQALTMADVVRRVRTSIGAFYVRVPNKESLLAGVYERNQRQMADTIKTIVVPEIWRNMSVDPIIRCIVHILVDMYRPHRGLLRALVIHGYIKPDWRYRAFKERNQLSVARVGALIASRSSEFSHSEPKIAGSLSLLMVLATLCEKTLSGDSTASVLRISDKKREDELVRAYLAYLGAPLVRAANQRRSRKRITAS